MRERKKQAVVIGSEFGGLAIAARLQAAGMQVTLLEKKDIFDDKYARRPRVGTERHRGKCVRHPGVLLSAETTYGCIAEDLGLPDQWEWDEPGRVDLQEAVTPRPVPVET